MSKKGETVWQKKKKNEYRLKAKEIGLYPSIQRSYYKKVDKKIINSNQSPLF